MKVIQVDPKTIFKMADRLPFGEGASINRPPLFCGLNYQFWKVRMKIFVESLSVISESKDLTSLSVASLFGKLREHELEMNRLNVQDSEDKHTRSIALKASKHKGNQESNDESDGETLACCQESSANS